MAVFFYILLGKEMPNNAHEFFKFNATFLNNINLKFFVSGSFDPKIGIF